MSRNGSGVYNLPAGNPVVTGTTITTTWANSTLTDIASALTGSVAADGQTPMSGNLNMANNKIVSVTDPTSAQDAATKAYVDLVAGGTKDGSFVNLAYSGTLTGGTGVVNLGSGQVYKDASGNVGIGTTSPASKLQVAGTITSTTGNINVIGSNFASTNYTGSSVNPTGVFTGLDSGGGYVINVKDSGYQAFSTNNTEKMRLTSDGNLGIGTNSPTSQLQVYGTGQTTGNMSSTTGLGGTLYMQDQGNSIGNGGAVLFGANQGAFAAIKGYILDGTANTAGHLIFSNRKTISDSTLTEAMRLSPGGALSIGTTSAPSLLNVKGNINAIADPTGGAGYYVFNGTSIGTAISYDFSNSLTYYDYRSTLKFRVIDNAYAVTATFTGDGKFGIGTEAPTSLLDVNSDNVRIRTSKTPASASSTGTTGQICWDSNYVYVCVATNTWKRSALSTW